MSAARKVVKVELDAVLYESVLKAAKSKALTLNEAMREALRAWAAQEGDLSSDPLFNPNWGFSGRLKADASKVNEVVYRRRKRRSSSSTPRRSSRAP